MNGILNTPNKNSKLQFTSDIFDLGYLLLTCALGDLNLYDYTGFLDLNKLKSVIELFNKSTHKQARDACCILHSEQELRKFHSETLSTTRLKDAGSKSPLQNNFQLKSPKDQDNLSTYQQKASIPFTLLELLESKGRYSADFIDLLCKCLQLQSTNRPAAKILIAHKFFSSDHISVGPIADLSELINVSRKGKEAQLDERSADDQLNRVFEAMKIVLLNREAREKMSNLINGKNHDDIQSREYRKLKDLAAEFGVPISKVLNKFKDEILPTLSI